MTRILPILFCSLFCLSGLAQSVTLVNPSFEFPAVGEGYYNYTNSDGLSGGWSWSGGGVAGRWSAFVGGSVPDGIQAAFIQGGTMSQTFTSGAGSFQIGFSAAARPSHTSDNIALQIDGTQIGYWASATFPDSTFVGVITNTTLSAGTHTLSFVDTSPGGDTASAIDAVYISAAPASTNGGYIAVSAAQQDVQTAVNLATNGQTVFVPAGTNVWTGSLTINQNIKLIGAGIGQTVIVDEVPNASKNTVPIILWATSANGFPRLSGFTFQGGITNTTPTYAGDVAITGDCPSFRCDHCFFNYLWNVSLHIRGTVYGVIDHCQINQATSSENGICFYNGGGWGDASWSTPVQWGGTNFMYVEDCGFYGGTLYVAVNDCVDGGRFVFRYNMVTNEFIQNHGTAAGGQRERGGRAMEVYMNTFTAPAAVGNTAGSLIYLQGGSGVEFSNTVTSYSDLTSLHYYSVTENFPPWGSANGQNLWDSNNVAGVLATGTHTGTNGSPFLQDTNATWSVSQWVGAGYICQDVTQGGTNTGTFSEIFANSTNTISLQVTHNGGTMSWNHGDTYNIRQVVYGLDQVGLGEGDLITGDDVPVNSVTGLPTWPREISEPFYQWGNTLNGTPDSVSYYVDNNVVRVGRDFISGTAKPGYTPLVYPHPLVEADTNAPATSEPMHKGMRLKKKGS